jgi:hypothetical protein
MFQFFPADLRKNLLKSKYSSQHVDICTLGLSIGIHTFPISLFLIAFLYNVPVRVAVSAVVPPLWRNKHAASFAGSGMMTSEHIHVLMLQ